MESDDDGDLKNVQQDIKSDQNLYRVWRPDQSCKLSNILEKEPKAFPKVKRRARRRLYVSGVKSWEHRICFLNRMKLEYPAADSAVSIHMKNEFKKREITTIPEEVFHYKRHSKSISAFKEKKNYQEKVASLTVTVGRLKEMCLAKPEVIQDTVPEEVMKLFSRIEI